MTGTEPSREKAPIWSYARALGKALIQVAPKDFNMKWASTRRHAGFEISCTIGTEQEAQAVCEIILHMARHSLSSYREAVRGDIYPTEPPATFREEMEGALGPVALLRENEALRHDLLRSMARENDQLNELLARDTDGSPEGPDRNGLDGEAATAGAEGIAQPGVKP